MQIKQAYKYINKRLHNLNDRVKSYLLEYTVNSRISGPFLPKVIIIIFALNIISLLQSN